VLLSVADVGEWLDGRGLANAGTARELSGGVSNVVLSVDLPPGGVVVKQALLRLRVPEEWLAKRERALTEAAALTLAARLTPANVPAVLAIDADRCALAIERAPEGTRCWKDDLLAGVVDPTIGTTLGTVLRTWHDATRGDVEVAREFGDGEALEQLRIAPFHRTVAERLPDVAPQVLAVARSMAERREALVHGDFSPKNVLVGPISWVVDFEVAHVGDTAFDVAFLLAHLVLKATLGVETKPVGEAFLDAYGAVDEPHVAAHVGCLLLARVVGRSQVDYLTEEQRRAVTTRGRALLTRPGSLADIW
jgi:aminoglycoside phosphotransferase (APT) family kinase protein